jgi:membrane-associated phospholipid phosphatase
MMKRTTLSLTILTLLALAVGVASFAAQGPLPGDVDVTLALQSAFGPSPAWAEWLTETAKPPLLVLTLTVGAGLAWLAAGWRGGLALPLAFGLSWLIDKALRALIFAPRPAADVVEVASASGSSGLPSTFGLVFGSIFGIVLIARPKSRNIAPLQIIAVILITLGAAARVVLGGHWPSQMLVSILLGLAAASAAQTATNQIRL